ncbi:MAG: GDP-mannose 4,6-dehydratase [Candidatus Hydrogenedentota bacterium]
MSRRALITGAEGFVGGHLTGHLRATGWDVVRASLAGEPGTLRCDIRDVAQVSGLFAQAGPVTHVFHLAGVALEPEANASPNRAFQVNLEGTVNLLTQMQAVCPGARFINIGSAAAYGLPQHLPITEEHPLEPAAPYGISKAAADHYCAFMHHAFALDIVRMRPFNHSGPGQPAGFVLPGFAHQIAAIERGDAPPVVRVGNLAARRDFLHVRDVVRAYESAARDGASGAAYNVCSGNAVCIRDALDRLIAQAGTPVDVEEDPARMRPVDTPEVRGSHARLSADTGWEPATAFDTLLADLLDDARRETGHAPGAQGDAS